MRKKELYAFRPNRILFLILGSFSINKKIYQIPNEPYMLLHTCCMHTIYWNNVLMCIHTYLHMYICTHLRQCRSKSEHPLNVFSMPKHLMQCISYIKLLNIFTVIQNQTIYLHNNCNCTVI